MCLNLPHQRRCDGEPNMGWGPLSLDPPYSTQQDSHVRQVERQEGRAEGELAIYINMAFPGMASPLGGSG